MDTCCSCSTHPGGIIACLSLCCMQAHLFTQQGSATPLDHIELVIDLICSINGQIDVGLLIQGGKGDAQTCARHRQMSLVVPEARYVPSTLAGTHALPAHKWQWTLARLQCP